MADIEPHGTCMCGKALFNEDEAKLVVKSKSYLRRYYLCKLAPEQYQYHVSKNKAANINHGPKKSLYFRPARVLRELKEDMSAANNQLRQAIIDYMKREYERDGTIKHTSESITKATLKKRSTWHKQSVMSELSRMKTDGLVINLEKGPGNSVYVGSVKLVEKATEPKSTPTVSIPSPAVSTENGNSAVTVKTKTPAEIAANPFDKVNSQLDTILSMLSGLAQGYSEIVKSNAVPSTATVDAVTMVGELNAFINDKTDPNSLVMRIQDMVQGMRKDIAADIGHLDRAITSKLGPSVDTDAITRALAIKLDRANLNLSDAFRDNINRLIASVDGSDDYKNGIKDGIKMAVELGLTATK